MENLMIVRVIIYYLRVVHKIILLLLSDEFQSDDPNNRFIKDY